MDAQAWLKEVKKIDELIAAKLAERDRLIRLATDISPTPPDGMPHGGAGLVSRKVENAVVNLIVLGEELDKLIDHYINYKQKVVDTLEKLPPREYGVLHRRYIRYMTWEAVAEDMGYSVQHIWRIEKKALETLNQVMLCYPSE